MSPLIVEFSELIIHGKFKKVNFDGIGLGCINPAMYLQDSTWDKSIQGPEVRKSPLEGKLNLLGGFYKGYISSPEH